MNRLDDRSIWTEARLGAAWCLSYDMDEMNGRPFCTVLVCSLETPSQNRKDERKEIGARARSAFTRVYEGTSNTYAKEDC